MARRPITPFATLPAMPPAHSAPNQALATHLPAGALPPAALPADTAPPSESAPEGAALPHGIAPDNLAAVPRGCGVYVVRGEGALPLYIVQSVTLRARVLSHLRSADEAAMLAQSRRVDTYRTAGEIGALLLEAQWVKQHMPLYNIRLRRSRSLVAWQLHPDGASTGQPPQLVDSTRHDFAHTSDLYGLYASRRAAQEDLRTLAADHRHGRADARAGRVALLRQRRPRQRDVGQRSLWRRRSASLRPAGDDTPARNVLVERARTSDQ